MEKKELTFYKLKERIIKDVIPMPVEIFTALIKEYKPKLFYNSEYSAKIHVYEVKEYKDDSLIYTSPAWADKTPKEESYYFFYKTLKLSTIQRWYTEPILEIPVNNFSIL